MMKFHGVAPKFCHETPRYSFYWKLSSRIIFTYCIPWLVQNILFGASPDVKVILLSCKSIKHSWQFKVHRRGIHKELCSDLTHFSIMLLYFWLFEFYDSYSHLVTLLKGFMLYALRIVVCYMRTLIFRCRIFSYYFCLILMQQHTFI